MLTHSHKKGSEGGKLTHRDMVNKSAPGLCFTPVLFLTVYPHCFAACVCLRGDYLSAAGCRLLLLLANGQEVFNVEGTADFTENLIDSLTLISPLPSAISLAESLPKSHLQ